MDILWNSPTLHPKWEAEPGDPKINKRKLLSFNLGRWCNILNMGLKAITVT